MSVRTGDCSWYHRLRKQKINKRAQRRAEAEALKAKAKDTK